MSSNIETISNIGLGINTDSLINNKSYDNVESYIDNNNTNIYDNNNSILLYLNNVINQDKANSIFFKKFPHTLESWIRYEQKLSEIQKKVANVLTNSSISITSITTTDNVIYAKTYPNEWNKLRKTHKFSNQLNLSIYGNNVEIFNYQNNKTKDKIIADKAIKDFTDAIIKIDYTKTKNQITSTDFIETKIAQCIMLINSLSININDNELFDTWFGIGSFIENLGYIKVRNVITNCIEEISELLIGDLKYKYQQFEQKFCNRLGIKGYSTISKNYAELFLGTSFNKIIPKCSVNPYKSQLEILSFVNSNFTRPYVCVYNTIMGMGKTTVVASLAKIFERTDKNKTLIYVCPEGLSSVREMVGSLACYLDENFAIGTIDSNLCPDGTYKLNIYEQNISLSREVKPSLILIGISTLIEMLKKDTIPMKKSVKVGRKTVEYSYEFDKTSFTVFFDENTVTLDESNSPMIEYLAEFYHLLPHQTIFSSATHPNIYKLDKLRSYISSKYNDVVFCNVDYSEVKIGTQLNKLNGQMIIPHKKCQNSTQLENFINQIKDNLMYKKFYTFSLVNSMYDKLIELGLGNEIPQEYHFENYLNELSHRNQESIQNLGIIYLKLVLELSREEYEWTRYYSEVGLGDIIQMFNSIDVCNVQIDYNDLEKMAKTNILKGQTFISCLNPYQEMMNKFGNYINNIKQLIGKNSFFGLKTEYDNKKKASDKNLQSKLKSSQNDGMSKLDRVMMSAITIDNVSDIVIPSNLGLKGVTLGISKINSENIPDSEEYDNLLFALLLGIVVYRKDSNKVYHDEVKNFISTGNCVYVFADSSLNYGNSFPFNNGIVLDEMSHHSSNTLLQLFGRAGRPNLSSYAIIYAGELVCQKLFDPIYNQNYVDWEKINLEKAIKLAIVKDFDSVCISVLKNIKDELNELNELNESNKSNESNELNKSNKLNKSNINIENCIDSNINYLYTQYNNSINKFIDDMNIDCKSVIRNCINEIIPTEKIADGINHMIIIEVTTKLLGVEKNLNKLLLLQQFNSKLSLDIQEILIFVKKIIKTICEIKDLNIIKTSFDYKIKYAFEQIKLILSKFVTEDIKKLFCDKKLDEVHQNFIKQVYEWRDNQVIPIKKICEFDKLDKLFLPENNNDKVSPENNNEIVLPESKKEQTLSEKWNKLYCKTDLCLNNASKALLLRKSDISILKSRHESKQISSSKEEIPSSKEQISSSKEQIPSSKEEIIEIKQIKEFVKPKQEKNIKENIQNLSLSWRRSNKVQKQEQEQEQEQKQEQKQEQNKNYGYNSKNWRANIQTPQFNNVLNQNSWNLRNSNNSNNSNNLNNINHNNLC